MKIPLAICLFTSTKGHFNIKTRYLETVQHFNNQIPITQFAGAVAHIKISPNEQDVAAEMRKNLEGLGFKVKTTDGVWNHGQDNSHQIEYLKDITKVFSSPEVQQVPYSLFLEDDMKIVVREGKLEEYFARAISILERDQDIISVRIARSANEMARITNLRAKHGIDSHVAPGPRGYETSYFFASDYSNNPHVCRSRDMRNAMILMQKINGFPAHSEHGTAMALKIFSNSKTPIAVLNPEDIVARHCGTEIGLEEPLDKDIILD